MQDQPGRSAANLGLSSLARAAAQWDSPKLTLVVFESSLAPNHLLSSVGNRLSTSGLLGVLASTHAVAQTVRATLPIFS